MPVVSTIIAGIGLAVSAAGTVGGMMASKQQAKAQKRAQVAQNVAESQRRQQMELDAQRKKREAVRQQITARSQAVATMTAQGVTGDSSAMAGVEGTISSETNRSLLSIEQNRELGSNIFDANEQTTAANMQASSAASRANMFSGLTSLGGSITSNSKTIAKIGGWS